MVESEALRTLEQTNKRLESELGMLREALKQSQDAKFSSNIDHFTKIQDLFNKTQIENKELRSTNKKLESKLEAQQRLVTHLQGKITTVMEEKEDIIVHLKSDIVLLRSRIDDNDQNFNARVQAENNLFQKDFQQKFSS
jgi:chromosome segregation ATPase